MAQRFARCADNAVHGIVLLRHQIQIIGLSIPIQVTSSIQIPRNSFCNCVGNLIEISQGWGAPETYAFQVRYSMQEKLKCSALETKTVTLGGLFLIDSEAKEPESLLVLAA